MDPHSRKPSSPMLSRYLEGADDLFIARLNGLTAQVRVDRKRFIGNFLESFDKAIPPAQPPPVPRKRRLPTIKEDSSLCNRTEPERSAISQSAPSISEVNIQDLDIFDIVLSDEQTIVSPNQPAIVYRTVNSKPLPSVDSGLSGISFLTEQPPVHAGQENTVYRSVNTKPSAPSHDSGLDVGHSSLQEPHVVPISSSSIPSQNAHHLSSAGSTSSDIPEASSESRLTTLERTTQSETRLLIPARRHMLVGVVNTNVRQWFGEAFQASLQEAEEIEQGAYNGNSHADLAPQSQQPANRGAKRKGADDREDRGDDDSDSQDQPKRRKSKLGTKSKIEPEKFACPCFKKEPHQYSQGSDCATHDWNIKRLK